MKHNRSSECVWIYHNLSNTNQEPPPKHLCKKTKIQIESPGWHLVPSRPQSNTIPFDLSTRKLAFHFISFHCHILGKKSKTLTGITLRTSSCFKMVAPSFVISTSPISSTNILSNPTGPRLDLRMWLIDIAAVTLEERTSCPLSLLPCSSYISKNIQSLFLSLSLSLRYSLHKHDDWIEMPVVLGVRTSPVALPWSGAAIFVCGRGRDSERRVKYAPQKNSWVFFDF